MDELGGSVSAWSVSSLADLLVGRECSEPALFIATIDAVGGRAHLPGGVVAYVSVAVRRRAGRGSEHGVVVLGGGWDHLEDVPVFDDLAACVETEDVDAGVLLVGSAGSSSKPSASWPTAIRVPPESPTASASPTPPTSASTSTSAPAGPRSPSATRFAGTPRGGTSVRPFSQFSTPCAADPRRRLQIRRPRGCLAGCRCPVSRAVPRSYQRAAGCCRKAGGRAAVLLPCDQGVAVFRARPRLRRGNCPR